MNKTTYKNRNIPTGANPMPKLGQNHPAFHARTSAVLSPEELRGIIIEMLG